MRAVGRCVTWCARPAAMLALLMTLGQGAAEAGEAEFEALIRDGRDCLSRSTPKPGSPEDYKRLLDDQACLSFKQKNYLRCAREFAEARDASRGEQYYQILRRALLEADADAGGGRGAFRCQLVSSDERDLQHLVDPMPQPGDSYLLLRSRVQQRLAERGGATGVCVKPVRPGDGGGKLKKVLEPKDPLPQGAFPETVALIRAGAEPQAAAAYCSGVVVSREMGAVLTAAHCVCGRGLRLYSASEKVQLRAAVDAKIKRHEADAICQSGQTCVLTGNDVRDQKVRGRFYPVVGAVPFYVDSCPSSPSGVVRGKDLALVFVRRIEGEVAAEEKDEPKLETDLNPRCGEAEDARYGLAGLARERWVIDARTYRRRASQANATLHAVGFGRSSQCPGLPPEPPRNPKKLWAHIPVRSAWCGRPALAGIHGCRADREAVLISERRPDVDWRCMPDTCRGDSGGPVFWRDESGYHFLAAITSRGLPGFEQTCGPGGIYSLVTQQVVGWMRAWGVVVHQKPTPAP